jgi:uncharacterized protein HemY
VDRKALEQMLAQGNDSSLLRYTLGSACLKEGLLEQAVEHIEAAIGQDAEHSASWKAYGKALTRLSHIEEAITAYERGISVADERGDVQAAKEMKVFLKRLKQDTAP